MNNKGRLNIIDEYRQRQEKAEKLKLLRKKEINKNIPEFADIDKAIADAAFNVSKKLLNCNDKSYTDTLEQLNTIIAHLIMQKASLLTVHGYSTNYLEDVYECQFCLDKGYIEEDGLYVKCGCHSQLIINELFEKSNACIYGNEIFENFNLDFYEDDVNLKRHGMEISPRHQMQFILDNCIKFVEDFTNVNVKNMVFTGNAGLGKTYLCNAIAINLLNKGFSVIYLSAPELFSRIVTFSINSEQKEENIEIRKMIFGCDLLIIDDLGTEKQTETRYSELLEILNFRGIKNRKSSSKTIISTNLDMKNIYEYYGERVASRLIGEFEVYRFIGEDIRLQKKKNKH